MDKIEHGLRLILEGVGDMLDPLDADVADVLRPVLAFDPDDEALTRVALLDVLWAVTKTRDRLRVMSARTDDLHARLTAIVDELDGRRSGRPC